MREFFKIARGLFLTPWLYVYSLISILGTVAAHRNVGIHGSPWLGGAGIVSSIVCVCIFYWQLGRLRDGFNPKITGIGIFLSSSAFRIRLMILGSPLVGLFYYLGYFSRFSDGYLQVAIAEPADKFNLYAQLILSVWPVAIAFVAAYLIDEAGRGVVVAQGHSGHALKRCRPVVRKLWLPLSALTLGALVFEVLGEFSSTFDHSRPWDIAVTPRLIYDCATTPLGYAFDMASLLYLGRIIRQRLPEVLGHWKTNQ